MATVATHKASLPTDDRIEELYDDAPCGFVSTTADGTIIRVNRTFSGWVAGVHAPAVGRLSFAQLLTPGSRLIWLTHHVPQLERAGHLGAVVLDLDLGHCGTMPVLVGAVLVPRADLDRPLVRLTAVDARERRAFEAELLSARRAAERARWRISALQHVTESAVSAAAPGDLFSAIAAAITRGLTADCAAVWAPAEPGGTLELVASFDLPEGWAPLAADGDVPQAVAEAWRSGSIVDSELVDCAEDARLPTEVEATDRAHLVAVPLTYDDECLGVVAVHLPHELVLDADDLHTIETMGTVVGQAVARARARLDKEQLDQRLRLTVQNAPVGMTMIDLDHRFVEPNERLCRMLGYPAHELVRQTFDQVTHADDLDLDLEHLAELVAGTVDSYSLEKRYLRSDGSILWGRLSVSVVADDAGAPAYFVSQIEDVTELREARAELQRRALYDSLTGLANRSLLMDRLTVALDNGRHPVRIGVAFCDLDHFKAINDTHGHQAGDEVLREVARRLQHAVRGDDTVARLGGDEFVVVLHDVASPSEAAAVLRRAGDSVKQPIVIGDSVIHTSLSGGLVIGAPGDDPDALLRDADAALYAAKDRGRGRIELHEPR